MIGSTAKFASRPGARRETKQKIRNLVDVATSPETARGGEGEGGAEVKRRGTIDGKVDHRDLTTTTAVNRTGAAHDDCDFDQVPKSKKVKVSEKELKLRMMSATARERVPTGACCFFALTLGFYEVRELYRLLLLTSQEDLLKDCVSKRGSLIPNGYCATAVFHRWAYGSSTFFEFRNRSTPSS